MKKRCTLRYFCIFILLSPFQNGSPNNIFNLKNTLAPLKKELKEASVLYGALAWENEVIMRMYDFGHGLENEPTELPNIPRNQNENDDDYFQRQKKELNEKIKEWSSNIKSPIIKLVRTLYHRVPGSSGMGDFKLSQTVKDSYQGLKVDQKNLFISFVAFVSYSSLNKESNIPSSCYEPIKRIPGVELTLTFLNNINQNIEQDPLFKDEARAALRLLWLSVLWTLLGDDQLKISLYTQEIIAFNQINPLNNELQPLNDQIKNLNDELKPLNEQLKPFNDKIKELTSRISFLKKLFINDDATCKNQLRLETLADLEKQAKTPNSKEQQKQKQEELEKLWKTKIEEWKKDQETYKKKWETLYKKELEELEQQNQSMQELKKKYKPDIDRVSTLTKKLSEMLKKQKDLEKKLEELRKPPVTKPFINHPTLITDFQQKLITLELENAIPDFNYETFDSIETIIYQDDNEQAHKPFIITAEDTEMLVFSSMLPGEFPKLLTAGKAHLSYQNHTIIYSDCFEQAFKNLLNVFTYNPQSLTYSLDMVRTSSLDHTNQSQELQTFYATHKSPLQDRSQITRNEFSSLLTNQFYITYANKLSDGVTTATPEGLPGFIRIHKQCPAEFINFLKNNKYEIVEENDAAYLYEVMPHRRNVIILLDWLFNLNQFQSNPIKNPSIFFYTSFTQDTFEESFYKKTLAYFGDTSTSIKEGKLVTSINLSSFIDTTNMQYKLSRKPISINFNMTENQHASFHYEYTNANIHATSIYSPKLLKLLFNTHPTRATLDYEFPVISLFCYDIADEQISFQLSDEVNKQENPILFNILFYAHFNAHGTISINFMDEIINTNDLTNYKQFYIQHLQNNGSLKSKIFEQLELDNQIFKDLLPLCKQKIQDPRNHFFINRLMDYFIKSTDASITADHNIIKTLLSILVDYTKHREYYSATVTDLIKFFNIIQNSLTKNTYDMELLNLFINMYEHKNYTPDKRLLKSLYPQILPILRDSETVAQEFQAALNTHILKIITILSTYKNHELKPFIKTFNLLMSFLHQDAYPEIFSTLLSHDTYTAITPYLDMLRDYSTDDDYAIIENTITKPTPLNTLLFQNALLNIETKTTRIPEILSLLGKSSQNITYHQHAIVLPIISFCSNTAQHGELLEDQSLLINLLGQWISHAQEEIYEHINSHLIKLRYTLKTIPQSSTNVTHLWDYLQKNHTTEVHRTLFPIFLTHKDYALPTWEKLNETQPENHIANFMTIIQSEALPNIDKDKIKPLIIALHPQLNNAQQEIFYTYCDSKKIISLEEITNIPEINENASLNKKSFIQSIKKTSMEKGEFLKITLTQEELTNSTSLFWETLQTAINVNQNYEPALSNALILFSQHQNITVLNHIVPLLSSFLYKQNIKIQDNSPAITVFFKKLLPLLIEEKIIDLTLPLPSKSEIENANENINSSIYNILNFFLKNQTAIMPYINFMQPFTAQYSIHETWLTFFIPYVQPRLSAEDCTTILTFISTQFPTHIDNFINKLNTTNTTQEIRSALAIHLQKISSQLTDSILQAYVKIPNHEYNIQELLLIRDLLNSTLSINEENEKKLSYIFIKQIINSLEKEPQSNEIKDFIDNHKPFINDRIHYLFELNDIPFNVYLYFEQDTNVYDSIIQKSTIPEHIASLAKITKTQKTRSALAIHLRKISSQLTDSILQTYAEIPNHEYNIHELLLIRDLLSSELSINEKNKKELSSTFIQQIINGLEKESQSSEMKDFIDNNKPFINDRIHYLFELNDIPFNVDLYFKQDPNVYDSILKKTEEELETLIQNKSKKDFAKNLTRIENILTSINNPNNNANEKIKELLSTIKEHKPTIKRIGPRRVPIGIKKNKPQQ